MPSSNKETMFMRSERLASKARVRMERRAQNGSPLTAEAAQLWYYMGRLRFKVWNYQYGRSR